MGDKLWKELVGSASIMKVTSVQLAFTGIEVSEAGQQSIEGFFKNGSGTKRLRDEDDSLEPQISFTCPRCNKEINLPTSGDEEFDQVALEGLKMEHSDWHFARDLSKAVDDEPGMRQPLKEPVKKKKRIKESPKKKEGIEKFFTRR